MLKDFALQHLSIAKPKDSKIMSKNTNDFTPPPQYSQTRISNESYTNVTTTKNEADGSISQHLQIISKTKN
jgi:hypothetical protein